MQDNSPKPKFTVHPDAQARSRMRAQMLVRTGRQTEGKPEKAKTKR